MIPAQIGKQIEILDHRFKASRIWFWTAWIAFWFGVVYSQPLEFAAIAVECFAWSFGFATTKRIDKLIEQYKNLPP